MPISKKQLRRMVLFVGELKTNSYPNSYSFAEKLRNLDIVENQNINCTARTVQRDIQALREEFKAPLRYSHEHKGYLLDSQYWEFSTPVVSDLDMLAMVLGCRLAENIFPEPLKTKIKEATAQQLTTNANELLETAYLESLMVCSRMTVHVSPEIFRTVFDAWKSKEALDIEYTNAKGERSGRRIDPHIIAFYDGAWYIKAYCHLKRKVWVFSLHRVNSAARTGKFFESDRQLIEETRSEGLFVFEKIKNIVLRCDTRITAYARDYVFHPGQKRIPRDDGTFDLHIPHAPKDDIIRWIMWQAGQVEVVKPKTLRSLIAGFARKITQRNTGN